MINLNIYLNLFKCRQHGAKWKLFKLLLRSQGKGEKKRRKKQSQTKHPNSIETNKLIRPKQNKNPIRFSRHVFRFNYFYKSIWW